MRLIKIFNKLIDFLFELTDNLIFVVFVDNYGNYSPDDCAENNAKNKTTAGITMTFFAITHSF